MATNEISNQVTKNELIAQLWFKAFNDHDIEELLNLYDEDAKHYSPKLKLNQPETNGCVSGKNALRLWWTDAFNRLPQLYYKVTSLTSNNGRVFMEYIRQVPNEIDMLIVEVLEINHGKIITSRVYHE